MCDKSASRWQEAIEHCKAELERVTKRKKQLEDAISTFKANLKRGIPWSGEGKADRKSATQN